LSNSLSSRRPDTSDDPAFAILLYLRQFKWVPLGIKYRRLGQKKLEYGLLGRTKSLASSAVWIQSTYVMDGRTDRQTDGHRTTAKTALTHSVAR